MKYVKVYICTPLSALLYFCAFHSPTGVTHPWLLLKLPLPIVEITHWKQVVAVTSWLLTVRVDSPTPPGRALPWGMKGPLVTSGVIVWSDIEASPVTSQFGRTMVLLYWHVTVNTVGTVWFSQTSTFQGSLVYPTCMEQCTGREYWNNETTKVCNFALVYYTQLIQSGTL